MAAKKKAAKAGAGAVAAGTAARNNPYVQKLVEDSDLRDDLRTAFESARKAVLDKLFGPEEEFEYTSTTTPEPSETVSSTT